MTSQQSIFRQESLALATSQIHRSRSFDELKTAFLTAASQLIGADAYGMYLFNDKQETQAVVSLQANKRFLAEYEDLRKSDPLFIELLKRKQFTHSLGVFEEHSWFKQPLYHFLNRWGLSYSIEAPLISDGKIMGTLNIASGSESYFAQETLSAARFLCNEINYVYQRLLDEQKLSAAASIISRPSPVDELPKRARQVLELAVNGYSNRSIAHKMNISENTVRHHVKRLYQQLGVHNRAQLAQCALGGTSESAER